MASNLLPICLCVKSCFSAYIAYFSWVHALGQAEIQRLLPYWKRYIKTEQELCFKVFPRKKILWLICWQNGCDEPFCLACSHRPQFLRRTKYHSSAPNRQPAGFSHLIKQSTQCNLFSVKSQRTIYNNNVSIYSMPLRRDNKMSGLTLSTDWY